MSVADTLLLINDDPRKPLNQHINDDMNSLKQWISDGIRYIPLDYILMDNKSTQTDFESAEEKYVCSIKHDGVLNLALSFSSIGVWSSSASFTVSVKLKNDGITKEIYSVTDNANGKLHVTLHAVKEYSMPVVKGDELYVFFEYDSKKISFTAASRANVTLKGFPSFVDF